MPSRRSLALIFDFPCSMNEYISFGISDGLEITNLHMRHEATVLPNMPLNFRYLTQLKLIRMAAEPFGKQLCTILLAGSIMKLYSV